VFVIVECDRYLVDCGFKQVFDVYCWRRLYDFCDINLFSVCPVCHFHRGVMAAKTIYILCVYLLLWYILWYILGAKVATTVLKGVG